MMKRLLCALIAAGMIAQGAACFAEEEPAAPVSEPPAALAEETEAAPEAGESPAPEDSPEPKETPALDGTPVPDGTPAPDETPADTDAPEDSPAPEIPEDAEAWMMLGETPVWGDLSVLVEQAPEGSVIWLRAEKPVFLEQAPFYRLSRLKLRPDQEVFAKGEWRVACFAEDPESVEQPEELDPAGFADAGEDATAPLYIWTVEKRDDPAPEPGPTFDPEAAQISVKTLHFPGAGWCTVPPEFLLSGIPEGADWNYAAVVYDERIENLQGDAYIASEEGVYTLRFVILDASGDILSASGVYTILLDCTAPEVSVQVDGMQSYTLTVTAADDVSRVKAVSVDGGASWSILDDGGSFTYTAPEACTLEPGQVQVRDSAGNVWASSERYELKAAEAGGGGYGGGGGGGDGGSGQKPLPHAAGEGAEGEYGALELELPEEPMRALVIGGAELPLTLELANAEGVENPADAEPMFTAELAVWAAAHDGGEPEDGGAQDDPAPDTLILTAVEEPEMGDRFEYRWRFSGEVLRLLSNSGVRTLALEVNGQMAAFPTEGFTGGTKYAELRMAGVSMKKFDYTVSMTFDLDPNHIPRLAQDDFSESCDLAILAEAEGGRYVLSAEQKGEMYYYNVYLGPREMMNVPYGEYAATTRS